MAWIGRVSEGFYYNPTRNTIPTSILAAHFDFALAGAVTKQLPGQGPNARYDDIPSPWATIRPRMVTVPVLSQTTMAIPGRQARPEPEAERGR